jgi:hypothetical protein
VTRALWRRVSWPLLVCALSLVPILGVFTRTRIFYVRDLSFFFYSRHLWLRHALFGGQAPWWDPHVAAGQSAVADAMNQIFMPLTLAVRLLPSDIISFNLWVALPLPLSALGTYLFLRRRALTPGGALTPRSRKTATVRGQSTRADGHSDPQRQHRVDEHSAAAAPTPRDVDLLVEIDKTAPHRGQSTAAALGACAFGLSGVTVSMLNTPNLSWSVAGLPWLLWTVERILQRGARTDFVLAALVVALQALCGEPVTWASGVAVAIAYAAWTATPERRLRVVVVVSAALAGTLLAAVQLVPTMIAGVRAHRGTVGTPDFWSFHPLAAVEFAMPHLFGNYYDAFLADIPWMTVLNSGRDPFYYSVYIGTLVLLLAATGAATRRRQGILWGSIALLFAFAAMGGYTPFYPTLRRLVPPLAYFRFPVKYLAITAFAVAVLAADGWQALGDAGSRRTIARICRAAGTAALIVTALLLVPITAHAWAWQRAHELASWLAITRPDAAADFLLRLAPPLGARAAGMLLAGTALLAVAASGGPRAPRCRAPVRRRLRRSHHHQPRSEPDDGGGEAAAARNLRPAHVRRTSIHRRPRARLHEHEGCGRVAVLEDPRREHRHRRPHGAQRRAADGAVGVGAARGAVVRSACALAFRIRAHRPRVRARRHARARRLPAPQRRALVRAAVRARADERVAGGDSSLGHARPRMPSGTTASVRDDEGEDRSGPELAACGAVQRGRGRR